MKERVHFRLIVMPCCSFAFCNVNPRLPSYCPECGDRCYPEVKSCVTIDDPDAVLAIGDTAAEGVRQAYRSSGPSHER